MGEQADPRFTDRFVQRRKSHHANERPRVLGKVHALTQQVGSLSEPAAPRALAVREWDGACPGCGLVLSAREGPKHAYLGASAACWNLYRRLASPSIMHPDGTRVRRLVQDAYAAQHPGKPQRRSVQSVSVHLMDLCLLLERDGELPRVVPVLGRMPPRKALDLHWLEPPAARGRITVADALDDRTGDARAVRVEAWASDVWAAWKPHHATVRRWLDAVAAQRAGRVGGPGLA